MRVLSEFGFSREMDLWESNVQWMDDEIQDLYNASPYTLYVDVFHNYYFGTRNENPFYIGTREDVERFLLQFV